MHNISGYSFVCKEIRDIYHAHGHKDVAVGDVLEMMKFVNKENSTYPGMMGKEDFINSGATEVRYNDG